MSTKQLCSIGRRTFCSKSSIIDHASYFTNTAKRREPSPIRELAPLLRDPQMISLAGGVPNPSTFPFKSFTFQVPSKSSILNTNQTKELETLSFSDDELSTALQYTASKGIPQLHEWIQTFHNNIHKIPYNNWDLCISTGSQDLICRTFDAILEDGDTIIIEAPTYSGTLAYLKARNVNIISINIDNNGMIVDELEDTLSKLNTKPKIIYTIPIGQNPSGTSYSFERKQKIYEIASKYDMLIFEDDPYYFLDFKHMDPDKNRAISFQSMDIESRVIRSDSFSKILSSGLRLGYLSAHSTIIRNIELHIQSTSLHTSALSQMCVYKLLSYWNQDIFERHLNNVCRFYFDQRNIFEDILNEYLKDKCEWNVPNGGMFYWLKVVGIKDTEVLIKEKARDAKVLLLPGKVFYVDDRSEKCSYVRAAYSIANQDDMKEGIRRFNNILNDV